MRSRRSRAPFQINPASIRLLRLRTASTCTCSLKSSQINKAPRVHLDAVTQVTCPFQINPASIRLLRLRTASTCTCILKSSQINKFRHHSGLDSSSDHSKLPNQTTTNAEKRLPSTSSHGALHPWRWLAPCLDTRPPRGPRPFSLSAPRFVRQNLAT